MAALLPASAPRMHARLPCRAAPQAKRLEGVKELAAKRVRDEALRFRQILERQRSYLGASTSAPGVGPCHAMP